MFDDPALWIGLFVGAAAMLAANFVADLWFEQKRLRQPKTKVAFQPAKKSPPIPAKHRQRTSSAKNGRKARMVRSVMRGKSVKKF